MISRQRRATGWSTVLIVSLALTACAGVKAVQSGNATWQYQLQGEVDTTVDAGTFVIDGFDTPASTVEDLHGRGRTVICYINVGALESWRPDSQRYPADIVGGDLDGWAGERWLDIRRVDALSPILSDRFAMCDQKGFDGVEADNVDGFTQQSGFPLTASDQVRFNRAVAALAHRLDLTIGLKNDLDQVDELVDDFDFAVNESCARYRECEALRPFVDEQKPVLHVEYDLSLDEFCPTTVRMGFRSIRKSPDLRAPVEPCPVEP